jgi:hypothetical protein
VLEAVCHCPIALSREADHSLTSSNVCRDMLSRWRFHPDRCIVGSYLKVRTGSIGSGPFEPLHVLTQADFSQSRTT